MNDDLTRILGMIPSGAPQMMDEASYAVQPGMQQLQPQDPEAANIAMMVQSLMQQNTGKVIDDSMIKQMVDELITQVESLSTPIPLGPAEGNPQNGKAYPMPLHQGGNAGRTPPAAPSSATGGLPQEATAQMARAASAQNASAPDPRNVPRAASGESMGWNRELLTQVLTQLGAQGQGGA